MNKIKYISLDTRFNTSKYHFPFSEYFIEFPERIHHVKSLSIISVEIPITFYNICDALNNNQIKITNMSTPKCEKPTIINLPDNNYTIETLQKTMSDKLKESGLDDLQVDMSNNKKLDLSSKNNDYLIDFSADNKQNTYTYNIQYKLGSLLGFQNSKIYINKDDDKDKNIKQKMVNEKPSEKNEKTLSICNLFNPRYLYLEVLEYEHYKHDSNNYLFSSSTLGCHISKHIIARMVIDYKNFPHGSLLPANLVNGYLISSIRYYKKAIKLDSMNIRLVNEFGIPLCLNGFEISLCVQVDCEDEKV